MGGGTGIGFDSKCYHRVQSIGEMDGKRLKIRVTVIASLTIAANPLVQLESQGTDCL